MPDPGSSVLPESPPVEYVLCRRATPRYPCPRDLLIRFVVRPSFANIRAYVRDISLGGIGLFLDRPLEPGAVVALQMSDNAELAAPMFRARVAQVTPLPGDGWIIGCEFFDRLRENELALIVAWFF